MFHFANGFERGGEIFVDYVRHESFNLGDGSVPNRPPTLNRMVIDPTSRTARDVTVAEFPVEFPRINEAFSSLPTRFVYVPTLTDTLQLDSPPSSIVNTIVKANAETGETARYDFGHRIVGEATFIPRGSGGDEDDGYLALFAFDPVAGSSDLALLDAAHIDDGPVAIIRMPQRVPQGCTARGSFNAVGGDSPTFYCWTLTLPLGIIQLRS